MTDETEGLFSTEPLPRRNWGGARPGAGRKPGPNSPAITAINAAAAALARAAEALAAAGAVVDDPAISVSVAVVMTLHREVERRALAVRAASRLAG